MKFESYIRTNDGVIEVIVEPWTDNDVSDLRVINKETGEDIHDNEIHWNEWYRLFEEAHGEALAAQVDQYC